MDKHTHTMHYTATLTYNGKRHAKLHTRITLYAGTLSAVRSAAREAVVRHMRLGKRPTVEVTSC